MSEQSSQGSPQSWPSEPDQPMPDQGPLIDDLAGQGSPPRAPGEEGERSDGHVTLGLESEADGPEARRPLSHPRSLVGEEPATGDVPKPG